MKDLAKEEREEIAKTEVKNWFINFENGDSALIYCDQPNIGSETIHRFAERTTGEKVIEVYHVPQQDLQYYCIGVRLWCDTPEKAEKIRKIAA